MKERGMIFNGEMVRALLDGSKTQTRRPVGENLKDIFDWLGGDASEDEEIFSEISICSVSDIDRLNEETGKTYKYSGMLACNAEYPEEGYEEITCPFGQIGDRIWVRETFASIFKDEGPVCYRATDSSMHSGAWKPSIHMPRWASRITLEITDIRVERIQDISEQDAIAEGVKGLEKSLAGGTEKIDPDSGLEFAMIMDPKFCYQLLWNSIYGNWNENPWVWVIEFKRIDTQQEAA